MQNRPHFRTAKAREEARAAIEAHNAEWSGSCCPRDPDNCWIDDATGEHVNATTGERTRQHPLDANAQALIAAAPDLLAALEAVCDAYGCECIEPTAHCPMCLARAALAKATAAE